MRWQERFAGKMAPMKRRHLLTATACAIVGAAATRAEASRAEAADAPVIKLLDDFAAAWNRHDVDGLMACMAPECAFETAAGKDVNGTRHVGRDAVRRAYAAVFETYADARWNHPAHFVAGDRAVSEWTFTGTTKDGTKVEMNGCDIFTLQDGKIALKNSYRKQRG
jgi:taurine dehydrogenase small subunit